MARPVHIATLIQALQFQNPQPKSLRKLSRAEWEQLLAYSDLARLTLILGQAWPEELPDWVRERIARNLADNTERLGLAQCTYRDAADALRAVGADHLVLKGFSQWPYFVSDVRLRPQADLDLYCPCGSLFPAQSALFNIGYEAGRVPEAHIGDHLPVLIRDRGGHGWRGNAFDPDITLAIELHYQFWGRSYARFGPTDLDIFWSRRCNRFMQGMTFQALDPLDAFAFSALHALRHLIYGGLAPYSIHEVGFFLHHNAHNDRLWTTWLAQHNAELRPLVATAAFVAAQWFGCRLPEAVEEEIKFLPQVVFRWFKRFGDSSLVHLFEFNKDAVWLHLGLIDSSRERTSVLVRRLFPLWFPPLNSRWVQESDEGDGIERRSLLQKCAAYLNWFAVRIARHIRALPSTLWGGVRLWVS